MRHTVITQDTAIQVFEQVPSYVVMPPIALVMFRVIGELLVTPVRGCLPCDYASIAVCIDCVILLANGETPPNMDEADTDRYLEAIEHYTEGRHVTLGRVHECTHEAECEGCDDSLGFSWSLCDMCRRPQNAGDRYAATIWLR